jgi:hypothetical protein
MMFPTSYQQQFLLCFYLDSQVPWYFMLHNSMPSSLWRLFNGSIMSTAEVSEEYAGIIVTHGRKR